MPKRATIVLDVGKTLTKLSLWGPGGDLVARRSQVNERIQTERYVGLDAVGIERFLERTLSDFAGMAHIGGIIPVAHGAAAAWVRHDRLVQPPLDYEQPIPHAMRREYDVQRDPFALTGSPALPDGLNLGAQLHYLEALQGAPIPDSISILPWAQYWSWLLSGVISADLTNLGCHTDLWFPLAGTPSKLSIARGWARHLAPLASPGRRLGLLTPEWARRTGLPGDVEVHCGLHDSNAALAAARAFPELAGQEATVLSTGTWFVAMRTPSAQISCDIASLPEARDCLVNVDTSGSPVPSARFMGGREIERLSGATDTRVDAAERQEELLRAVAAVVKRGSRVLPSFAPGTGPFPSAVGRWDLPPEDASERLAAVCLYAALLADISLDLIGARERLLIEGRFSRCEVLIRALASWRPQTTVYVAPSESEVAFGALRLLNPGLAPASCLTPVSPLPLDLRDYRERWRQEACAAK
jgi:sugar (pentulose or hexulose) kinase